MIQNEDLYNSEMHFAIEEMGKTDYLYYKKKFIELINQLDNVMILYNLSHIINSFVKAQDNYEDEKKEFEEIIRKRVELISKK